MQRILCSGMPITKAASSSRWMCGVWLDIQIVYSSVPGLYQPMSPRTSIGFGISRWLTIRWRTTTSAPSTAASVPALSPTRPLEHDVVRGVLVELRRAGLRSPSRRRPRPAAAPSRRRSRRARRTPAPRVSATTAATPSPVHLTLSVARVRGVLTLFWMPALPPAGQAIGSGLYGMSAPTKTATTPGIAFAADGVDRADVGVRVRAAQDGHVGHRRRA